MIQDFTQHLALIQKIFDSQTISAFLLEEDTDWEHLEDIDHSLRTYLLSSEQPYASVKQWLCNQCLLPNVYIIENFYEIYNVYVRLDETKNRFLCMGPFTFASTDEEKVSNYLTGLHLSPRTQEELLRFYRHIPVAIPMDRLQSLLTVLFSPILGGNMRIIHGIAFETSDTQSISFDVESYIPQNELSLSIVEQRYHIEQEMIEAVKHFDTAAAIHAQKKMRAFNYGKRTPNQLRNAKNFLIVLNTLLRKAAQECDVHPFYVDEISRTFAVEIEQCTSSFQLDKLSSNMIRKYSLLIHNHSLNKYSANIQKCVEYMDFHYEEDITLTTMADYLNLNASYLSTAFKKELGVTLTQYLAQVRTKHALFLLNSTRLPIQDIAMQCGYDDLNYFSRIFKKYQGMSPSAYRKMLKE